MILVSSKYFGQLFCPSSGALDCVLQLVTQYSDPEMGKIIARSMMIWLELLISRYCCF